MSWSDYPYLWSSVATTALAVALMLALPRQRTPMLTGGLINTALAWCVFALEGEYWTPRRLGGGVVGIEDLLMAFACAVIAWAIAQACGAIPPQRYTLHRRHLFVRVLGPASTALAIFFALWTLELPAMSVYVGGMVAMILVLLAWRPALWRFTACGATGFLLFWMVVAWTTYFAWPGFVHDWNAGVPWGRTVAGIPLGEVAWGLTFGASFPLYTAFVLDVQPRRSDRPAPA